MDLCVRAMLAAAVYISSRRSADFVLFDGRTFSRREQLDEVVSAAEQAGVKWRILYLHCADEVAEGRLQTADTGHPARNRNPEMYRRIKASFEPILYPKLDIDTTIGIEPLLKMVLEDLRLFPRAL